MKTPTNKILAIAAILLLLINIALVIFIINGRKHSASKRRGNPFEMMDKDLDLIRATKEEVKKLRDKHFETIRPLSDSVRAAKSAYFGLIKESNVNDSTLNAYRKRMSDIQSNIDRLSFAHLQRVRRLFNEGQPKKI